MIFKLPSGDPAANYSGTNLAYFLHRKRYACILVAYIIITVDKETVRGWSLMSVIVLFCDHYGLVLSSHRQCEQFLNLYLIRFRILIVCCCKCLVFICVFVLAWVTLVLCR